MEYAIPKQMNQFKELDLNPLLPCYAVGDIHGMFWMLDAAVQALDARHGKDQYSLVLLGDLINRGPESFRAIEYLEKPNVFSVSGNHEESFLRAYTPEGTPTTYGVSRIAKYNTTWVFNEQWVMQSNNIALLRAQLELLPIIARFGDVLFIHADPLPNHNADELVEKAKNNALSSAEVRHLRYERDTFSNVDAQPVANISRIFSGHSITPYPVKRGNCFYLDTEASGKHDRTFAPETAHPHLTIVDIAAPEEAILEKVNIGKKAVHIVFADGKHLLLTVPNPYKKSRSTDLSTTNRIG